MYLLDEKERSDEVKSQEGFGSSWTPSPLLEEAMKIYQRQCTTTASLLLEDMRYGLESIRKLIRRVGREMNDDEGASSSLKIDKALDAMTKAVDKIPDLAKKLVEAERSLARDFASDDTARGSAQKAIGEDV